MAKGIGQMNLEYVYLGFGIGLFGFFCFHRVFILTQPKIKAKITSRILDNLPKDGVLVEGLIAYPIAYQSHKRIVVIPHTPDMEKAKQQIDLSLKEFNLHYAVYSELWKTEEYLGYPAIEYIKKLRLLKTIQEDNEIYYIYEI